MLSYEYKLIGKTLLHLLTHNWEFQKLANGSKPTLIAVR